MSEELTLLPCPACGASDVVLRVDTRAYGFCHACGMCGPCAPKVDAEYAVKQWNALPRALEWTDEPPKVPGWYWFKDDLFCKKGGIMRITDVWIEEIKKTSGPHDQWAGPIPEPREPKE